jgi:putative NIF3 family GTP cyclohydrolase 1 type 2
MKLEIFYRKAIEIGINNDFRSRERIDQLLKREKEAYKKLTKKEKTWFDQDRLFNPFADSRILNGDAEIDIARLIVGIDMEVGEILLARELNRGAKKKIDLIVAHHPEGRALARLSDVMRLQSDRLTKHGVAVAVAEQLMSERIDEVARGVMPANHNRAVDAARALGFPMICLHTPADNCVTRFLTRLFEEQSPATLKDLVDILLTIPEYQKSARLQTQPRIVSGGPDSSCGKIYVDMTGGTGGSMDIYDRLAGAGTSTIVGMHMSEKHLEKVKKAKLNVVIAGHVSSDTLGLNLLFDEIEKSSPLDFVGISGYERFRR